MGPRDPRPPSYHLTEVKSQNAARGTPAGEMTCDESPADESEENRDRAVRHWLLACAAMVCAMLVAGGITRLTHSGLSMVSWRPISGALPPLRRDDWEALFAEYRRSPQFLIENPHMTLEGFRGIFWWEYLHRLLGRATALTFAVPLPYFWRARLLTPSMRRTLPIIAALGLAQGALGWWMVRSGLVRDPRVSPLRLALHLGMAFVLAGLLVRAALEAPAPSHSPRPLARAADLLAAAVLVMALSGALVAGNHAGLAFNTWPLMAGRIIPPGLYPLSPWYLSAALDVMTVQFNHRALALALCVAVCAFWTAAHRSALSPRAMAWCHAVVGVFALQFTLGVTTLLYAAPTWLAVIHQANAMALFLTLIAAGRAIVASPDEASLSRASRRPAGRSAPARPRSTRG